MMDRIRHALFVLGYRYNMYSPRIGSWPMWKTWALIRHDRILTGRLD